MKFVSLSMYAFTIYSTFILLFIYHFNRLFKLTFFWGRGEPISEKQYPFILQLSLAWFLHTKNKNNFFMISFHQKIVLLNICLLHGSLNRELKQFYSKFKFVEKRIRSLIKDCNFHLNVSHFI